MAKIQIETKTFNGKWQLAHTKEEGFDNFDKAVEWANKNLKEWRFKI